MNGMLYIFTGIVLFCMGLAGITLVNEPFRRILCLNIMGTGILLVIVAIAYRGVSIATDPIPHALVLTGIVVTVAATALALVLTIRIQDAQKQEDALNHNAADESDHS